MTLQLGLQTITIHILANISRSKGNQAIKSGQVKECNNKNIFFKNHVENETGRRVPDLFLFFKKAYMK